MINCSDMIASDKVMSERKLLGLRGRKGVGFVTCTDDEVICVRIVKNAGWVPLKRQDFRPDQVGPGDSIRMQCHQRLERLWICYVAICAHQLLSSVQASLYHLDNQIKHSRAIHN